MALLAEIAEQVADAIQLADPEKRIQYVNKAYEEMFGYSLEEIKGFLPSILNPDESGHMEASIQSAADKGISAEFELPQKRKDGSIIFTRLRISPIKNEDGEIAAWVGIHSDITERRKMEEALRQSEEMFRLIGEKSTDAVILIVNEKIIYVNPEASRIIGYDEEEFLSGNMWIADIVAPEQHDEILDRYRRRMAGGEVPNEYAMDIITREGERRTLDVRVATFEMYGRTAVLFCARDVTERKRMEQRMFVAQKAESVQRLAGGIAHDFNNLLVGIMGNTTLLQSEMGKDERHRSILEQIESASRQAARLTGQLLAYARGGRYQPEVLDTVPLIEESLPLLRASLTSGVELATEFGDDVPCIEADRSQIEQILLNLCLNAAEAMSFRGKLTIRVGFEENENGRWVRICFEDTGPGLPKEVISKIFDPFFSTKGTGRGMGMAAVYGIAQNHGGEIKMENLPGCGAAFTMYLPAVDKEPTATSARKASADTGGGEKILVVDDEDIIRDVAKEILIRKGYDVVTACSGDDALRVLEEIEGISLVILDILMPGLGGQEVCRLIRDKHPDLKVLFSSGYNEPTADDDNETGDGFIQKPYSSSELTNKVREILDYHG